jgi:DNA processing protein
MASSGLHLTAGGPSWPAELSEIEAPPEELWARGRLELLARAPRVAIVGTRAPTPYGQGQARRFARALAEAGAVIVSGLARGVDAAAHEAALDAGGATIAVLGSGVDRPWPTGPLTDRMLAEGLLLSEHSPGEPPKRHHFPLRNRLISGLCRIVLVVEAAEASGSLITARWAADQGRSVGALPGRVDHPMARGCHRLIREGAMLVEDPEELLAELSLGYSRGMNAAAPEKELDGTASALLEILRGETLTPDELVERARRPLAEVLATLVELELAGRVSRGPGALYRLV